MDLIDPYQMSEQPVSSLGSDNIVSIYKLGDIDAKTQKETTKMKKPRFVPWEPYKAAPSAYRRGEAPDSLPMLIPYGTNALDENFNKRLDEIAQLVDARKTLVKAETLVRSDKELLLERELNEKKSELQLERRLNAELKRLMVATISDELQTQVEALTEDKIRLAHRVEEYTEKLMREDEQVDQLLIERDIWKCKFLAQSIRTDELTLRAELLLGMLRDAQRIVQDLCDGSENVNREAKYFAELNLATFFARSPCEERVRRKAPNYSNVTISCCRKCSGREIHLL